MGTHPTALLFLHGIGDTGDKPWDQVINSYLVDSRGFFPDGLNGVNVVAPQYIDLLRAKQGSLSHVVAPPRTYSAPSGDAEVRVRRRYLVRQNELAVLLDQATARVERPKVRGRVRDGVRPLALATVAQQARNYAQSQGIRSAVVRRVLDSVGSERRIVIIAHSLGTVVALDVVHYLRKGSDVPLLLTVASPLLDRAFSRLVAPRGKAYQFPYGVVAAWVNLFNPLDHVAGGGGLRRAFPEALDVMRPVGVGEHALAPHLDDPQVLGLIGVSLYPPRVPARSRDHARSVRIPESAVVPLVEAQLALRIEEVLERSGRDAKAVNRWEIARQVVAERERSALRSLGEMSDRPEDRTWLDRIGLDNSRLLRSQLAAGSAQQSGQVALLLALTNPIEPFDIHLPDKLRREAEEATARDLGLAPALIDDAHTALSEAAKVFKTPTQRVPRPVWVGLGAVGVAAAIAAPALLFAGVAGAGAAGAAAITTALASFGPGGMIGGLLTLTFAVGGGSTLSAIGTGRALATVDPESFKQAATELLASAVLDRQVHAIDAGEAQWVILTGALAESQQRLFQLKGVSDDRAQAIKELQRKSKTAEKALDWLRQQGFERLPGELTQN